MPIFDQGYQHWNGTLASHAWRWWAIARQGIRAQLRNRRTKYLVIAAWVPALVLVVLVAVWGLFEQKSSLIQPFLFLFQALPAEIQQGPKAFRSTIWTLLFNFFLSLELSISMLLVLMVGPDLISQDLRFNAVPLYLSRPMRRLDYFAGKFSIIAIFIAAVTIVPVLIAYFIGVAFSLDIGVVRDTWRILLASIAYGAVAALVCGLVMLACSSLSRNSRVVSLLWVGIWIISGMVAGMLIAVTRDRFNPQDQGSAHWRVVSFTENLNRVREALLDTDGAYDQLESAIAGVEQFGDKMKVRGPARILLGGRGRARARPMPRDEMEATADGGEHRNMLSGMRSPFPWTWSAGVLAGLSGLSLCILSTRIKSLDRLR